MFYDNDTKVTGIHGELWNLLADYLNFTYGEYFLLHIELFFVIAYA